MALVLGAAAWLPLVTHPGFLSTRAGGDSPFLLIRLQQLVVALRDGAFPVRWMPDAAYGLGYPFFNYYAPLPYYLAAAFHFLGFGYIGALKLTHALGFVLASAGAYWLASDLWDSRPAGLLASLAYTYAPFHLTNVYVRGDSLGEFYVFAFYPLIFLALRRLRTSPTPRRVAWLGLAYAGLILSHNISALIFSPFVVLYLLALLLSESASKNSLDLSLRAPHGASRHSRGKKPVSAGRVGAKRRIEAKRVMQRAARLISIRSATLCPWATGPRAQSALAPRALHRTICFLVGAERGSNPLAGRRLLRFARNDTPYLGLAVAGLALGLVLSAWYWLPALAEQDAVQLQENLTGYFHYSGHFRGRELLQLEPLFNYTLTDRHTPFVVGLAQAVVIVLGLAGLVVQHARRRRLSTEAVSLILVLLGAVAFITSLSAPLWARIPLLPFVQFPWRFLSVVAFAGALLAGGLVPLVPLGTHLRGRGVGFPARLDSLERLPHTFFGRALSTLWERGDFLRWLAAGLAGLVLLAAGVARLPTHFIALSDAEVTPQNVALYEWFTGNIGSTVRAEYLPTTVNPRPHSSAVFLNGGVKPPPLTLDGDVAEAHLLRQGARDEAWSVEVVSPEARLAFHTYAFPGWQATVDDRPVPAEAVPGLGYLALTLPAGRHLVTLSLGRTPIRLAAEIIAALAVVTAVLLLLRGPIGWSRFAWWVGSVMVVLLALGALVRLAPVNPPADPATVTMDFHRDPYPHANPDGVPFGDEASLRGYSLSAEEVEPGATLDVALTWDPFLADARVQVSLTSPVDAIFNLPDVLVSQTLLMNRIGLYRLVIPRDAPRGVYLPKVEVVDEEESLGEVYLRPVRVRRPTTPPAIAPAMAHFGDRIALLNVEARRADHRTLEVNLTWQALDRIPLNYATSIRLLDAAGKRVAQRDAQPRYGFFPTSAWEPGEVITDRRWLSLPKSLPPGEGYSLEVVVYQLPSLEPIGTTRISGVSLAASPP